jgi:hypothetical protein
MVFSTGFLKSSIEHGMANNIDYNVEGRAFRHVILNIEAGRISMLY